MSREGFMWRGAAQSVTVPAGLALTIRRQEIMIAMVFVVSHRSDNLGVAFVPTKHRFVIFCVGRARLA